MSSPERGSAPPAEQGLMAVPAPPDATVAEPVEPAPAEIRFEHKGRVWLARGAGGGALGTGALGLAHLDAVHFYREGEDRPAYEALLARGRLEFLEPSELVTLLQAATPIVTP